MTRYTKNNLKEDLKFINAKLSEVGSEYSFQYRAGNTYHAVDLYKNDSYIRCVDCAEPLIKLFYRVQREFDYFMLCEDE